ncbi:MAG: SRPBCC family protein [Bradymonadia bacterium]
MRFLILMVLGCLWANSAIAEPTFNSGQLKKLADGDVLIQPRTPAGGEGVSFIAYALFKVPVERVWPVVRDCAQFKEFMPRTKKSSMKTGADGVVHCYVELSMPFPFKNLSSTVKSKQEKLAGGGFRRSWTLVEGTYKRNAGSWMVTPWKGDPAMSLLTYEVDVNPNVSLPDFIIRKAQTGTLPDVFSAVKKRALSSP